MKFLSSLLVIVIVLIAFFDIRKTSVISHQSPVVIAEKDIDLPISQKPLLGSFMAKNSVPSRFLSDEIKGALGEGVVKGYRYRLKKINRLSKNLSKADLRSIFNYLSEDTTTTDDVYEEALRNDLIVTLLNQSKLPEELGAFMVEEFQDPSTSYIWKDYLIQHLQPYVIKKFVETVATQKVFNDSKALNKDEEMDLILETYLSAVSQATKGYAGTALIGLERIWHESKLIESDFMSEAIQLFFKQPSIDGLAWATALQIIKKIDSDFALKLAVRTLESDAPHNDVVIASCLNVYMKDLTRHQVDPVLKKYQDDPLFGLVIKNNLK